MLVKRILLFLPLALILILAQSFFWVPTYDRQALGNPDRLVKYVQGTGGDAQILNPILSADTTSSTINNLVFDGLIDLDDKLNYRPRLAESWRQYEEAYLAFVPEYFQQGRSLGGRTIRSATDLLGAVREGMKGNPEWLEKIDSAEVVPPTIVPGHLHLPRKDGNGKPVKKNGRPEMEEVAYALHLPERIKFVLKAVDQDFFLPLRKFIGEDYFDRVDYGKWIVAGHPEDQPRLEPGYADLFAVAEHNPVIVFDLRRGVRFHDGHEFDSADVLFTYQAIMNPKNASPRRSDYEPVRSAEVLGKYRIRFVYDKLFSPAINSWFMGILPEHLLNDAALKREARERNLDGKSFTIRESEFNRHPVGTGPFVFKEWNSDERIRLVRNETYWDGAPEYNEYVLRIIPDSLTQEMEFYAGAVDNYSVQPHQVARFKDDPKYQRFSSLGYFYSYIGYNVRNPLFEPAEVRRALGMAIDVEKIIQHVLYGEGERVTGPFPKITDWYDHSIAPLPYDPKGALDILHGLGWKENAEGFLEKEGKVFEFNLITNNGNPIRKNILTIAQNSWRKLGIKCNTQLFEWAVFLKDFVNALKFDAVVLGWSMGIDPDLYQIWHSSQTNPNQLNFVGYENPEADRLILRIRKEYDKARQVEMAHELHRIIARDQPYTFLYIAKSTQLMDKKIVIVERGPGGEETYKKIYPTRDGRISFYFNEWRKLPAVPQFAPEG